MQRSLPLGQAMKQRGVATASSPKPCPKDTRCRQRSQAPKAPNGVRPGRKVAAGRAGSLTVSLKHRELTMQAAHSVSSTPSASCSARSSPDALLKSLQGRGSKGRGAAGQVSHA